MRDDAVVPHEVLLDRRLGDREKVLYALILLHQDEGGRRTDASDNSLAKLSGLSIGLIEASLGVLEECRYINRWKVLKKAPWEIEVVVLGRQKMQWRPVEAI